MKTFIITMAGLGSRFTKNGYTCPKYEIRLSNGLSLFNLSIKSLSNLIEPDDEFVFISRKSNNAREFILNEMNNNFSNIHNIHIEEIDYITDGQATTAYLAKPFIKDTCRPIIIYNIDTYIEPMALSLLDIHGDGWIPCFNGEGDHWSFCKTFNNIDENNICNLNRVIEVAEKNRISSNCSIGLYYFKSFDLYEKAYLGYNFSNTEKYIMPLYSYLINSGDYVFMTSIPKDKVHCLGTPEELKEYEQYISKLKR